MTQLIESLIEAHPAWEWLEGVKGIGATLAARLLTRLDITRAKSPAAFWAYCGLATVPAERFVCGLCGAEIYAESRTRFKDGHRNRVSRRECAGNFAPSGSAPGRRVAQARPRRGEPIRYDREAKKTCYLIGVSFVRCGGPYRDLYKERRLHLATTNAEWELKHLHLAALRATVKQFLVDLWVAWSESGAAVAGK